MFAKPPICVALKFVQYIMLCKIIMTTLLYTEILCGCYMQIVKYRLYHCKLYSRKFTSDNDITVILIIYC